MIEPGTEPVRAGTTSHVITALSPEAALAQGTVLLMAGGAGLRMGGETPKPLVPVMGLPMIERNLLQMLGQGARRVAISAPAAQETIKRWAEIRGRALAEAVGARLSVLEEHDPRGTLGAVAGLADEPMVLVQYADNVTGIDFAALAAHHIHQRAAMTLACHDEPFKLPFGRLTVQQGVVTAYTEKPTLPVTISSGAYVLGAEALARVPRAGRFDTPALAQALIEAGLSVQAFKHSQPWFDVNTRATLERLTGWMGTHAIAMAGGLERFASPEVEVVGVVLTHERHGVLLEWRPGDRALSAGVWDTPGGKLEPGESAHRAARREMSEELGLEDLALQLLCTFDDLDITSGRWVRHSVFTAAIDGCPEPREGQRLGWSAELTADTRTTETRTTDTRTTDTLIASPARRSMAWSQHRSVQGVG